MRRRVAYALGVMLLLSLALLVLRVIDDAPKGRARLPRALAARSAATADAPVPRRAGDPDQATLICDVTGAPEGRLEAIPMDSGVSDPGEIFTSVAHQDQAVLHVDPGMWFLRWAFVSGADEEGTTLYGYWPIGPVEVAAGEVRTCRFNGEGFPVEGQVVDPAGNPVANAEITGCGLRGPSAEDGSFSGVASIFYMDNTTGTCDLRALFADGLLTRASDAAVLSAFEVPDRIVLVLDTSPIAGLGIGFRPGWNGVEVTWVRADSPAERSGLEAGDLIVDVDGHSTADLSESGFVRLATGAEGTSARLTALTEDGDEVVVRVRRERIPDDG